MSLPREEETRLLSMLSWKEAIAIIGPRRVGKSTLALRLLEGWIGRGKRGEYLDLESLDAPRTLHGLVEKIRQVPKGGLVILDEVQAVSGWVAAVRGQVEQQERKVVVTGSSASLLSAEIASALAGRAVPTKILPLSFRDAQAWGLTSLDDYLETGGYPECVLRPMHAKKLHQLYLDLAILRDVAARLHVREIKPLSDLALLILSEPGKTISAAKTASRLGISQPTFRSFIAALNDAFLILSVPPYSRSPRERIVADAKHYAFDTGLQKSVSISQSDDTGRRLENAVAIELVRRGYSVSHFKTNASECDFVAQKPGAQTLAVQVYSGKDEPPGREAEGLENAMKACRARGLLLSKNRIEPKLHDAECKTAGDWLLEPLSA